MCVLKLIYVYQNILNIMTGPRTGFGGPGPQLIFEAFLKYLLKTQQKGSNHSSHLQSHEFIDNALII